MVNIIISINIQIIIKINNDLSLIIFLVNMVLNIRLNLYVLANNGINNNVKHMVNIHTFKLHKISKIFCSYGLPRDNDNASTPYIIAPIYAKIAPIHIIIFNLQLAAFIIFSLEK